MKVALKSELGIIRQKPRNFLSQMKKSRYTEGQIVKALKEVENGPSVIDISGEHGTNKQTFYNWKKK